MFSDFDWKRLHFRNNKVSWFQKLFSTRREERCRRKFLYQKALFYKNFIRPWEKNFRSFGQVVFGTVVKIPFYFCRGRFQGKISRKKVFFIVSRLGAKTRLLKKYQFGCENFILRVRRNFLGKNIVFRVIW